MPYAIPIPIHVPAKPSRGNFNAETREGDAGSCNFATNNNSQITRISKSLTNCSTKLTLSRTYFSTDHSHNLLPSKTQKKAMLIRAKTIDLPSIYGISDIANANSRMKHDIRPHLLVSFFAKHFEKMQKKITKRPLGSSLSFDLDERERINALQHGHDSNDKSIISLPANIKYPNSLHIGLNCFHCLIDASLRERKLSKRENRIRLWSNSDISSVHCTDSRRLHSQKFNTNCKVSLHDSIRIINK